MEDYDDLTENDLNEEYVQLKMAFPKLKKVCDPIAREPSKKANAGNLKETLQTVKTPILQKYSDYLYAPIFIRLSDSNASPDTICSVLECLKVLLEYVPIDSEKLFLRSFSLTFQTIYSESDDQLISNHPEELKLLVVTCLTMLFSKTSIEILKAFYTRKYLEKLGVAVYHVAVLARREKFIQLRIASLRCLQTLLQLRDAKDTSSAWRKQVAELLMVTFPGIVSCAVGVATSTDTLNHKIIVEAIHLWGRMIGLIMEDRTSGPVPLKTFKLGPEDHNLPDTSGPYSPAVESPGRKIDEWLTASGKNLVPSTEKIFTLQQHDHPRVRRQLVAEISHVLSVAPKNMYLSIKYLVDALICLGQDSEPEVAKAGKSALDKFSHSCELDASSKKLVEIVEESFYSLVTRLPRVLHGFDLSLKEKQLLLLAGYVDVLGKRHLPGLLNLSSHLNRLLKSLYTAATLDCSNVTLLEEQAVRDLDQDVIGHQRVWMVLKHCDSPKYLTSLQGIATKLLKYSESASIVHSMLDDFQNQPAYRKEITLLLNFMFDSNQNVRVDYDLTNQVLRTVMDLKLWDLPVSTQSADDKTLAQSNVVQICLLCELVATLAAAQGADLFVPNLLSCLYPLLECAGSPLYAVSSAGFASVGALATLYEGDVGHLVANNVDYLSYHVTLNLRHAHRNPRVLSVLSVIMNHSTYQVFPSLYEIVKDVLVQSCDTFQDVNASAFLQVFLTFVARILDWEQNKSEQKPPDPPQVAPSSAWNEIFDYYRASCMAMEYEDQPMTETEPPENLSHPMEASDESTETKVPDHIQLTIEMLNRSLHFLPSKEIQRQIQVLQILEKGVLVLSKWKDQLLPMVHKIWSPLVQRFSPQSDPLVIHRSFILLRTLATTSREFIGNRTSKEVIPFLCKYLTQQAAITRTERVRPSYKMTQSYKLVRALLCGLGDICVCLDLPGDQLESIVGAVFPYLSSAQPLPLQEAASDTIKTISTKDPNIVWVRLMDAVGSELNAPSSNLRSFKVEPSFSDDDAYRNNALNLLTECGLR